MRALSHWMVCMVALLIPSIALAGNGPAVLDLSTGVPKELLGKTLGLARSLWAFCVVLGLIVEAFGSSPAGRRDYAGCVWRALVVLALLAAYPRVFGSVINLSEGLAERIAPKDTWTTFAKKNSELLTNLYSQKSAEDEEAERIGGAAGEAGAKSAALAKFAGNYLGGMFFDSLLGLFVLVGQAAHWVLGALARILSVVYYLLGPLALVFAVPRGSGTGGSWFRSFVTVASWPIFSGVLLSITASFLFKGYDAQGISTAFGSVASALLLVVTALAIPSLASSIVGGGGNLIASGAQIASGQVNRFVPSRSSSRRDAGESNSWERE